MRRSFVVHRHPESCSESTSLPLCSLKRSGSRLLLVGGRTHQRLLQRASFLRRFSTAIPAQQFLRPSDQHSPYMAKAKDIDSYISKFPLTFR